jgi:SAM-dependent methyltransferase
MLQYIVRVIKRKASKVVPAIPLAEPVSHAIAERAVSEMHPSGLVELPPPELRYRVHGARDTESFIETGRRGRRNLEEALARIGREFADFTAVLDFGCGSARTLLAFAGDRPLPTRFYGTDIDGEVIAWGCNHLPYVTFSMNDALPPLGYPDGMFDLIYSISVFTHLNEEFQFQWLRELQRVATPGAILLLTVHGAYHWRKFAPELVPEVEERGFVFQRVYGPGYLYPEWFQIAHHTEEYVRARWAAYFEVVDYIPRGLNNHQDMVVLRKHQY